MMSDFRGGWGGVKENRTKSDKGVGRRAKIGHPIFQEFLPLFFCGFSNIFLFYIYFFSVTPL